MGPVESLRCRHKLVVAVLGSLGAYYRLQTLATEPGHCPRVRRRRGERKSECLWLRQLPGGGEEALLALQEALRPGQLFWMVFRVRGRESPLRHRQDDPGCSAGRAAWQ